MKLCVEDFGERFGERLLRWGHDAAFAESALTKISFNGYLGVTLFKFDVCVRVTYFIGYVSATNVMLYFVRYTRDTLT